MQLLRFAQGPETVSLGDVEVRRLGFDARQLSSKDRAAAHAVLRRAVELGVQFIATDGPFSDQLVRETLSPYPGDLVVLATAGACRALTKMKLALRPQELRATVDGHLKALALEQLQVVQLWWTDQPEVSFDEALDAMVGIVHSGKARQLALANVTLPQLEQALAQLPIAAVEAPLEAALLELCQQRGIVYTPTIDSSPQSSTIELDARRVGCTPAQLVIASLLAKSPVMLPVLVANKVVNLEEQIGAVHVAIAA